MLKKEKLIFDIENLYCGYNGKNAVLHIEKLKIPTNKIVFILGLSGIGKSTFIETLGLMNDTIINKDSAKVNFISKDNSIINISELWNKDDEIQSKFREKYLSFIFQNTNLMSNMTAGENVCINLLFEGGDFEEAKSKVLEQFKNLNLDEEKFDSDITALSGGERQRVAFVRGLIANYEVLFGDEPTGNLDKKTAAQAMNGIKESLINMNKSSLIVTHDPDLALNFGDSIILITPKLLKSGKKMGVINETNMYFKENGNWISNNGEILPNIKDLIFKTLSLG